MSDNNNDHKNTQTLGKGLLIILWITAIFMVMIMNDIKAQLTEINSKLSSTTRAMYMNDPSRMQVVDAKDGKTVIYMIQRVPEPEEEMMDDAPAEGDAAATKPAE